MSLSTILANVRTQLATAIGGAVIIHDGIRHAPDDATFRALFRDTANSRLNAWMVTHSATDEEFDGLNSLSIRTHEIVCVGLYALDDPGAGTSMTSEIAFRAQVESVAAQLRQNYTLGGQAMNASPPDTAVFELRMFHSHLCHYAEVRFDALERVSYTGP